MIGHVNRIGSSDDLRDPEIAGDCEWCDLPAVGSFPLVRRMPGKRGQTVRTGQHLFYCSRHQGVAERSAAAPL